MWPFIYVDSEALQAARFAKQEVQAASSLNAGVGNQGVRSSNLIGHMTSLDGFREAAVPQSQSSHLPYGATQT